MNPVTGFMLIILAMIGVIYLVERRHRDLVSRIEENIISSLLALTVIISFVQVILRYGFNSGIPGALETTTVLFAWMILFGASHAIKTNSHLGVEAFINLLPPKAFRAVAVFGAFCALLYAVTLISSLWLQMVGVSTRGGALDYWGKMYKLNIGMEDMFYPQFMQDSFGLPERVQRWVAYLVLPIGLSLFAYRSLEAMVSIIKGDRRLIIASHEAEELVAENKDVLKD